MTTSIKKNMSLLAFACFLIAVLVFLTNCRFGFYAYDAVRRAINDPPAGVFLYEDEYVRIETGRHKVVSIGGADGDNDTYRHFIRALLRDRDQENYDDIRFNVDPVWDDFYMRVQYKDSPHRTVQGLESVKRFLYGDESLSIVEHPDGYVVIDPPPSLDDQ